MISLSSVDSEAEHLCLKTMLKINSGSHVWAATEPFNRFHTILRPHLLVFFLWCVLSDVILESNCCSCLQYLHRLSGPHHSLLSKLDLSWHAAWLSMIIFINYKGILRYILSLPIFTAILCAFIAFIVPDRRLRLNTKPFLVTLCEHFLHYAHSWTTIKLMNDDI